MKKAILWIDDFDTKSSADNIRIRGAQLSNCAPKRLWGIFEEKYKEQVEIKTSFLEGMKYIIDKHGEYDCVILDIDMRKNFQEVRIDESNDGTYWTKFFKYVNIEWEKVKEGAKIRYVVAKERSGKDKENKSIGNNEKYEPIESYIGEFGGFYLIILLLALGFPKDRIVIFSAYAGENDPKRISWEAKFENAAIHMPTCIVKPDPFDVNSKNTELNDFLDRKYNEDYYNVRYFLYKMYNLVEDRLDKDEDMTDSAIKVNNETPSCLFNSSCRQKEKKLKKQQIKELYDKVLLYFPYFESCQNVERIFASALKQFSEPFEADYDKTKVYELFRVMKLFRNWSAHNLFNPNSNLDRRMFKLLVWSETMLFVVKKKEDFYDSEGYIEKKWKECEKLFDLPKQAKEIEQICEKMEKEDWKMCKDEKTFPGNMIDVYDTIGRKQKPELLYKYILDAFMNVYIVENIEYIEKGCKSNYMIDPKLPEDGMIRELLGLAYDIYEYM